MAFTDEVYTLQDCVYVFDLEKFFNTESVLERLRSIKILVVNGLDYREFTIGSCFANLTHLELRRAYIINPVVLKSSNIVNLCLFENYQHRLDGNFFIDLLNYSAVKHFSHSFILFEGLQFYEMCSKNVFFNGLVTLDCYLNSFETLLFISNNFKELKTLNVRIAKSRDELIDLLRNDPLHKLVKKLRSDLEVNFIGIPLNKSTHKVVEEFLYDFSFEIHFYPGRIALTASSEWDSFEVSYMHKNPHLFDGFFKQIDSVQCQDEVKDKSFYGRFKNVSEAGYRFWLEVRHDLPERFKSHPHINSLILTSLPDGHYLNDIMDEIPAHCQNLIRLEMEQWDDVNFDFLLRLPKLKTLTLYLRFSFNQSLFIEILRNLKHLTFCEIIYERNDSQTKEELSAFKRRVVACVIDELGHSDCVFKIEIHRRKSYIGNEQYAFVRYVMKRSRRDSDENSLEVNEHNVRRVMSAAGYKRDHPESSIEHDTMANIYGRKKKLS